ncbi:MAG: hypothetical protein ALECFALPRED_003492 [Alectoria fallacina]|uniref:Uncharacterized protein n=1 Tax=Alectoria fallacina TaxID=1903189 RepID=A0A8H3FK86_9LECA|nr:MAG: hypothetical protein ALECFALPRED_003492 [Alectoria fallacina]
MSWFSRAEDLDEERGTQLGTLGFLHWEMRQKIIGNFFDGKVHENMHIDQCGRITVETLDDSSRIWLANDFPDLWRLPGFKSIACLRDASASTKVEVEDTFLTKINFELSSPDALVYFLDRPTTYQQSLLRSITILLFSEWEFIGVTTDNTAWMDVCALLPSGLTSIKFEISYWPLEGWGVFDTCGNKLYNKLPWEVLGFLELLGKRIRRCWAPRAYICLACKRRGWRLQRMLEEGEKVEYRFDEVDDWNKEWLEWWVNSQDGDQTEGQSPLLSDHCDLS